MIILYGDHYPYGLSEEKQQLHFEDGVQKYKVPFIIYCDSHEFNLEIDRVCSTFDLLPTLSNMFELNVDNYYVGKVIFSEEQPTVYFYDRSWMNEQM